MEHLDKDKEPPVPICMSTPFLTVLIFVVGLIVSGFAALVYTPLLNADQAMRADMTELRRDVTAIQRDASPKPETKVAMDDIRREMNMINARLDRIGERVDSMHSFVMQVTPQIFGKTPLGKKQTFQPPD
jgi:hypothetical protein